MTRFLHVFNLVGVLALAVLCAFQWQANRNANLRAVALERSMQDQAAKLAERDKTIQGNTADLEDFRRRLIQGEDALKEAQSKIKASTTEIARLNSQRDELQQAADALKKNLEQWTAAVADRDKTMKAADEKLQQLAADRNDAVVRFNDLAAKYNAAQDQLKEAAEQIQKVVSDRNDAVEKFNDLATKYNSLVKQMTAAQSQPVENRGPP